MKKILSIIMVMVVVLSLLIFRFLNIDSERAAIIGKAFIKVIENNDFPAAYIFLSKNMQNSIPYPVFIELLNLRKNKFGKVSVRHGVEQKRDYYLFFSNNNEKIPWFAKYRGDGEIETIYEEIAVIKDGQEYRIKAYSSSQFFKKTDPNEFGPLLMVSKEELDRIDKEIQNVHELINNKKGFFFDNNSIIFSININKYSNRYKDINTIEKKIIKNNAINRVSQSSLLPINNFRSLDSETLEYKGFVEIKDEPLKKFIKTIAFYQIKTRSEEFNDGIFIVSRNENKIIDVGFFKINFNSFRNLFIINKEQYMKYLTNNPSYFE